MTTKFPEPKNDNWEVVDGWIFPDYSEPKLQEDPFANYEASKGYDSINSFEFQQGIFGQYRNFYGLKNKNSLMKACFKMCVNSESIRTHNLTQEDKVCARECLVSSESFEQASKIFLQTQQNRINLQQANNFTPIENVKFFNASY